MALTSDTINANLYVKFEDITNPNSLPGYKDFFPVSNYYVVIKNDIQYRKSFKDRFAGTPPQIFCFLEFDHFSSLNPSLLKHIKNGSLKNSIVILNGNKINKKTDPISSIILDGNAIKYVESKVDNSNIFSLCFLVSNSIEWIKNIVDMEDQTSQGKIVAKATNAITSGE